MHCVNKLNVLYSRKFLPGESIRQFGHLLSLTKFFYPRIFCPVLTTNILFRVNYYIEDMVTFMALVKIYSTEYFCNAKVAGIGKIFVQQKFSVVWYMFTVPPMGLCTYFYFY